VAAIAITPRRIPARSKRQGVNLALAGAGWSGATSFTLAGVAGCSITTTIVNTSGTARIVVKTGSSLGTLTISDGTNSGTTTVATLTAVRGWMPPRRRSRHDGPGAA